MREIRSFGRGSQAVRSVLPGEILGFPQFQAAAVKSFVPIDVRVRPRDQRAFRGIITSTSVADVHLSSIRAGRHEVERGAEHVRDQSAEFYKLSLQVSGSSLLVQAGKEAVLSAGDIAFYDTAKPYTIAFDQDYHCIVLMLPKELLSLPSNGLGEFAAHRITGSQGTAAVLGPYLRSLLATPGLLNGVEAAPLMHSALDLVELMLQGEFGSSAPRDRRADLVEKIMMFIDENLAEESLNPQFIARAHFISVSQLHAIFRAEGMTVAQRIRSRRLENCRRELLDPRYLDETITAIAARWGLPDGSHFSRLYKDAFGCAPSLSRQRAGLG